MEEIEIVFNNVKRIEFNEINKNVGNNMKYIKTFFRTDISKCVENIETKRIILFTDVCEDLKNYIIDKDTLYYGVIEPNELFITFIIVSKRQKKLERLCI